MSEQLPDYVRVTSAGKPTYWYADKIGEIFDIDRDIGLDYHVKGTGKYIEKSDCEPVESVPTQQTDELIDHIANLAVRVAKLESQADASFQPLTREILSADLPAIDRLEMALKHERHTADLWAIVEGAGEVDGEIKVGMKIRSKETGKTYEVVSRLFPDQHKLSLPYVSNFRDNFEIMSEVGE